jgi:hypothetical protein
MVFGELVGGEVNPRVWIYPNHRKHGYGTAALRNARSDMAPISLLCRWSFAPPAPLDRQYRRRHCGRFVHHENYDAVMGASVDLPKHAVVSAGVGTAAMAVDTAEAAYRMAEKLPVFGPLMRRSVAGLSERGDRWVAQSADQLKALVAAVAVALVDLVLDEMDLNALVRERVNIDALAADLDIEAVINRVDLIALADRVIEGVDLPAIIRESTNSMTAEVMTDVRTQGERADDVVSGIVDRMLGRDRENR